MENKLTLTVEQKIEKREESNNSIDKATRKDGHGEVKLLWLYWNTVTDEFCFDFKDANAFVKTLLLT